MTLSRMLFAVCAYLFLQPITVSATAVWAYQYYDRYEGPLTMYLVTDFDNSAGAATGALLDVYLDYDTDAPSIDPADLLTSTAEAVWTASPDNNEFDAYLNTTPPFSYPDYTQPPVAVFTPGPTATTVWLEQLIVDTLVQPIGSYPSYDLLMFCGPVETEVCWTQDWLTPTGIYALDQYIYAWGGGSYDIGLDDETRAQFTRVAVSAVPEPTTFALLSLGLVGLGFTRRRMKAS